MATPIPQHVEIVLRGNIAAGGSNSKPSFSVYHYRRTALTAPVVKANVATAFIASVCVPLMAAMNAAYAAQDILIRILDDALDPYNVNAYAGVGAIATDRMPTEMAVKMGLVTGVRSRNYLGSKHYAPLSEADTTADILTGTGLTNWTAVKNALLAGFTDSDGNVWVLEVVSKKLSILATNPTTINAQDVVNVTLNKNVGTMRRRRVRSVTV